MSAAIEARGRRTLRHPADVGDLAALRSLRDACLGAFEQVDVLVFAAGITKRVATLEMAESDWNAILDTNVTGMFRTYQVFAPPMIARGAGRLIGIASLASFVGLQEVAAYTASKAAVAGLTRALAVEWSRHGLTVNAIAPGVFETDLNRQILKGRARPGVSDADADGPLRPGRRAGRRGGVPGVGRVHLRDRPDDRGRRRLSRQWSEPVNPALVISAADNVATALEPLDPGRTVRLGAITITIAEAIPRGHKVALCAIRAGERVIKYGSPIGSASADIAPGTHVHTHNVASARGRGDLSHGDPRVEGGMRPGSAFLGYPRIDGRVGVRNHVLVVPTVICAAVVAERIAAAIAPIGAALPHLAGCGQLGPDLNVTHDTLAAYTRHPNVGAVIVVALGCEQVVAQYLADTRAPGGQAGAHRVDPGRRRDRARDRARDRDRARAGRGRRPRRARLVPGVGARAVGEVRRLGLHVGARLEPGRRPRRRSSGRSAAARSCSARSPRSWAPNTCWRHGRPRRRPRQHLLRVVSRVEAEAMALGLDIRGTQPSPGNIRGGLTTIEEKSLGATHKAGERTRLTDVVAYSAPITKPGLTVMDTPGLDVESVTGMVGGGAQIVVFTTGLGTPTGNPIAPVIKITGNARTAQTMADNTDVDVSGVITDTESFEQAAERLFNEVIEVSSGRPTAAERLGHREFAIHRRNPTI